MANAELVMFAIQSGVKLYGSIQKSYIESIKGEPLILPLPRSVDGEKVTTLSARNYFNGKGREYRKANKRIKWLYYNVDRLTNKQKKEFIDLYLYLAFCIF